MACTANNTQNGIRKAKPIPLCRWWLRTRLIPGDVTTRVNFAGMKDSVTSSPVVEFYVPWWAWPLEWMHRLVFGTVILCHGLSEELKDGNRSRMKEFDEKHRWD